jgi:membrane protein DedA with SNARE-associated domain
MPLESYVQLTIDFVRTHEVWAAPVVALLAFGEFLAFISLLIPAWGALVGIGALIGPSEINFWPIWVAGSIGAALGDWLSYWIGLKIGPRVAHIWPLSRHPDLIPRGERFMKSWGILGIFIGRFFGPLRASVPLVAGIFEMPYWSFQLANFTSAFVWAGVLLTLGGSLSKLIGMLWT